MKFNQTRSTHAEIYVGTNGRDTRVLLDGQDVSNQTDFILIEIDCRQPTKIRIDGYAGGEHFQAASGHAARAHICGTLSPTHVYTEEPISLSEEGQ